LVAITTFPFPYQEVTLILVAITTILAIGHWLATSSDRRARQRENKRIEDIEDYPFESLQCWIKKLEVGRLGYVGLDTIDAAEIEGREPDYKINADRLRLSETQYLIYIQVFTKMGMTIHKANLLFLGGKPKPQVITLSNPNISEVDQYGQIDSLEGRDLIYRPPFQISKGRAINHITRVSIESEYTGEIGLRLELQENGRSYDLTIPCTTKPPTQTTTDTPQPQHRWKFW